MRPAFPSARARPAPRLRTEPPTAGARIPGLSLGRDQDRPLGAGYRCRTDRRGHRVHWLRSQLRAAGRWQRPLLWGANSLGQLGDGTRVDSAAPVAVAGITDATALACGWHDTCALSENGMIRCWGANGGSVDGPIGARWVRSQERKTASGLRATQPVPSQPPLSRRPARRRPCWSGTPTPELLPPGSGLLAPSWLAAW